MENNKNENLKILVIEDKLEEQEIARQELINANYNNFTIVENLEKAIENISEHNYLLSDLFFSAGNIDINPFIDRFLPIYESYKEKRFQPPKGSETFLKTIETVATVYGVSPIDYVENIIKATSPPSVYKSARDAVMGVEDYPRYEAFLRIEEKIRDGSNLPLGIIATEIAIKHSIPSKIITSVYHDDDAFEAISSQIKVDSIDTLVDEHKNWKSAIEYI